MKKNKTKQFTTSNHDYLSFIVKNQQMIQQIQQFQHLNKRKNYKFKSLNHQSTDHKYYQSPQRYISPLPIFQDTNLNSQHKIQIFSNSLDLEPTSTAQVLQLLKGRKICGLNQKKQHKQSLNTRKINNNSNQLLYVASSEVIFPRLPNQLKTRVTSQSNSPPPSCLDSNTNSQAVFLTNQQSDQIAIKPLQYQPYKRYCQFFSDRKISEHKHQLKLHPPKFLSIQKPKKATKTISHSIQPQPHNKKSVDQTPIFRHLQNARRQKMKIFKSKKQLDLQKFLQANMIHQIRKKIAYNSTIITQDHISKSYNPPKNKPQSHKISNTNNNNNTIKNQRQQTIQQKKQSLQKPFSVSISPSKLKNTARRQLKSNQNSQEVTVYDQKIASYRSFIFAVNFCHRVFDPLIIKDDIQMHRNSQNKYKFYLGLGNNKLLVKSLMKRRFWWIQVDDQNEANFTWTQLKQNTYYQYQKKASLLAKYDKIDETIKTYLKKQKKLLKNKIQSIKKKQKNILPSILRAPLPKSQKKIFTITDNYYFNQMNQNIYQDNPKLKNIVHYQHLLKYLPQEFLKKRSENYKSIHVHNHFFANFQIGNKKALFYNLKHYYQLIGQNPFNNIPLTFHIKKGIADPQYSKFVKQFRKVKYQIQKLDKANGYKDQSLRNVWIVKPGQLSNRGNGITVIDELYQLSNILKKKGKHNNGSQKTYIVQKYIQNPMLYKNRKFDIRHYMMISRLHGRMRAYWFSEGYIRTSSYQFNLQQVNNSMIHLTNDAIQKHGSSYGKFQQGNKISYSEFQRYLDSAYSDKKYSFIQSVYPRMKQIATDAVRATYLWLDPNQLQHNFQIFGLDFMIDQNFKTWLIQVNTNPCLQLSSPLLGRIIPAMLQHTLRLALDPIFPPTSHYIHSNKYLAPNSPMDRLQFELIFDEGRDGKQLQQLFVKNGKADCGDIQEQDQIYENDGKQIELGCDLQ